MQIKVVRLQPYYDTINLDITDNQLKCINVIENYKMKYHKILSEFTYLKFGYPIYNYKLYACGASKLIKYDKNKVLNICSEILKEAKEREYINNLKSGKDGIQRIMNSYKKKKKSSLRKELKKRGLYVSGMDKKEMLETIEEFLI